MMIRTRFFTSLLSGLSEKRASKSDTTTGFEEPEATGGCGAEVVQRAKICKNKRCTCSKECTHSGGRPGCHPTPNMAAWAISGAREGAALGLLSRPPSREAPRPEP